MLMNWTSFACGVVASWAIYGIGFLGIVLRDNYHARRTRELLLKHLEANRAHASHIIGINEFPPRDQEALREAINEL